MEDLTLQICTPDGVSFEGEIISLTLRTVVGDVCILKHHINYMTPIESGRVVIKTKDGERVGACSGGFVSVTDNVARIIASTFEFADEIDIERANKAKEKAQARIAASKSDDELRLAEMKLKRALTRISVYKEK